MRRGRLTASNVGAALGVHPYKSAKRLRQEMLGIVEVFETPAMKMGTIKEDEAKKFIAARENTEIEETGLHIHPTIPWLAASPDGILHSGTALLEVKCPKSLENHRKQTATIPPQYLAQMQGQMAVLGRETVVYANYFDPDNLSMQEVARDPGWLERNLPRMQAFYDSLRVPAWAEEAGALSGSL